MPGLRDEPLIRELAEQLPVPLNLLSELPLRRVEQLGVSRVSTGSLLFRAAIKAATDAARSIRDGHPVGDVPAYAEVAARTLGAVRRQNR